MFESLIGGITNKANYKICVATCDRIEQEVQA